MTTDHDDLVERDDLAPAERLHIIAGILAQGIRRRRDEARRSGEFSPPTEREGDGLELSDPVRPDRPTPYGRLTPREPESFDAR